MPPTHGRLQETLANNPSLCKVLPTNSPRRVGRVSCRLSRFDSTAQDKQQRQQTPCVQIINFTYYKSFSLPLLQLEMPQRLGASIPPHTHTRGGGGDQPINQHARKKNTFPFLLLGGGGGRHGEGEGSSRHGIVRRARQAQRRIDERGGAAVIGAEQPDHPLPRPKLDVGREL